MGKIKMPRTDLALDAADFIRSLAYVEAAKENRLPEGIAVDSQETPYAKVTQIVISTEDAASAMGKDQGTYITLEIPEIETLEPKEFATLSQTLAEEIRKVCTLQKGQTALVVGLGNWNVTADSLGPNTVAKVLVSRHIQQYMPEAMEKHMQSVAAVSPGVLGITGMETGEVICGIAEKMKPDVIIAIDALASGKVQRMHRTIQIADTGISPGSGLGNHRMKLSRETLGIPVIAIGVPTVVDAVTFTADAVSLLADALGESAVTTHVKEGRYGELSQHFDEVFQELVVTPKNIDHVMDRFSSLIADGMNLALHHGMKLEEIHSFLG